MRHYLLLGAGFSRNWGGWLASEVFDYLLGCPEVRRNPSLRAALWKSKDSGGFEHALSVLRTGHPPSDDYDIAARDFEGALVHMFHDMNKALLSFTDLEFPSAQPVTVRGLLGRFDAIFTLNQDLLLEHRYMPLVPALVSAHGEWRGCQLPGLEEIPREDGRAAGSFVDRLWMESDRISLDANLQPVYKLHGSTNWRTKDGANVLIYGATKAQAIQGDRLLRSYAETFEQSLSSVDARLMVIGYGFGDAHINSELERAAAAGMRMFVIDPQGSDLARWINGTRRGSSVAASTDLEDLFVQCLIGASRRTLREIFGADVVEQQKLERFFSE